jgi:general stress protein 26
MENQANDNRKDLFNRKAINKLKELTEEARVCMFETILPSPPYNLRPMNIMETDDSGKLWFFSKKDSDKNREISHNPHVQLSFSNLGDSEYLSIYGRAEIVIDRQKFGELWNPLVKAWFPEGKDDPNLSLICVTPLNVYYWDTQHNKMVTLFKLAASAISGKTMDDSVEGELRI